MLYFTRIQKLSLLFIFQLLLLIQLIYAQSPTQAYLSTQSNVKHFACIKANPKFLKGKWYLQDGTVISLDYRLVNPLKPIFEAITPLFDISRLEFRPDQSIEVYQLSGGDRKVKQVQILVKKAEALPQKQTKLASLQQWIGQYKVLRPTSVRHEQQVYRIILVDYLPQIGKEVVPQKPIFFVPGKPLWAIVYFTQPLKNYKWFLDQNRLRFSASVHTALDYQPKHFGPLLYTHRLSKQELEQNYVVWQLFGNTPKNQASVDLLRSEDLLLCNLAQLDLFKQQITLQLPVISQYWRDKPAAIQGSFWYEADKHYSKAASIFRKLAQQRLAKVTLPLRKKQMPALEQEVLRILHTKASQARLPYQYQKVWVIENDWTIVPKDLSDQTKGKSIRGRQIKVAVLMHWQDGHCSYQIHKVFQWYREGRFQQRLHVLLGEPVQDILCERTQN